MESQESAKIGPHGFYEYEIHKIKRIATWAETSSRHPPRDPTYVRALFYLFTAQFKEREGKDFCDVFPEMEDYYQICEEALDAQGDAFLRQHFSPREAPLSP